jgi:hypothetical protein
MSDYRYKLGWLDVDKLEGYVSDSRSWRRGSRGTIGDRCCDDLAR